MPDGRRGLLKKTLGGAALLVAAGAVPLALRRTKLRPAPVGRKLQAFTEAEYSIWAAVADRVLAQESTGATREPGNEAAEALLRDLRRPPAPTPAQVDVAGKVDLFAATLPASDLKDLKRLLALFDNALVGVLLGGPPRPFTRLAPAAQDAQLRAWQTSRIALLRSGYQSLKRLSCSAYFSSPQAYAAVGYPGPPVELVRSVLGQPR